MTVISVLALGVLTLSIWAVVSVGPYLMAKAPRTALPGHAQAQVSSELEKHGTHVAVGLKTRKRGMCCGVPPLCPGSSFSDAKRLPRCCVGRTLPLHGPPPCVKPLVGLLDLGEGDGSKYLMVQCHRGQFSNRLMCLKVGVHLARALQRVLVLPIFTDVEPAVDVSKYVSMECFR